MAHLASGTNTDSCTLSFTGSSSFSPPTSKRAASMSASSRRRIAVCASDGKRADLNLVGSRTGSTFTYPVVVAGDYTYHCTIHSSAGMTGKFTATSPATGIRTAAMAGVRVFPVLTDDVVNVTLPDYSNNGMRLEVLDAKGSLVQASTVAGGANTVSLAAYRNGIYFLLVRNDEGIVSVTKVMKQ